MSRFGTPAPRAMTKPQWQNRMTIYPFQPSAGAEGDQDKRPVDEDEADRASHARSAKLML
jgi:hypothetical protein